MITAITNCLLTFKQHLKIRVLSSQDNSSKLTADSTITVFNKAFEKKNTTEHLRTVKKIEFKGNVNLELKENICHPILS